MAAAYPQDPFKQADSLLTGMIESYRGSTDATDMADIQSLLETTVKIARDREFRVHNQVKGTLLHVCNRDTSKYHVRAVPPCAY